MSRPPIGISAKHLAIALLWPSFVLAAIATGLFFSAFDPEQLLPFGAESLLSRLGAYSAGFLTFWAFSAVSAGAALYFAFGNMNAERARRGRDGAP